ncbi:MAG: hypothetical protein ACK40G_01750 [Cytophagaceae bacterium]
MHPITLYTKKIKLNFNKDSVAITDLEEVINEISKDYIILDNHPTVVTDGEYHYVTFRTGKKKESKSIGFHFSKK